MTTLSIDIETYSGTDLSSSGVYKYVEDPEFEILLFAYHCSDDEYDKLHVIDLKAPKPYFSEDLLEALLNPQILKTAWNAAFEITCISKYFGIELDPSQWECTMVKAAYAGLPLGLSQCAKAIGQEEQKMAAGKALIKYFCEPCKPTKVNGGRTRNLPHHDPEKWETFKDYCAQDVVTEMAIRDKLGFVKYTEKERRLWVLDQQINKRGIGVNMQLAENAISIDAINRERLTSEARRLTGLDNPNSPIQLISWIESRIRREVKSLDKESVMVLLNTVKDPIVLEVLKLRQEMGKTSVKKYASIESAVCSDGRVRGLLQFYGANRTGRWCLAEGTRVLVKDCKDHIYEKPIENVSLDDMVWDGVEWVCHEGVVYSGDKPVITWDAITATKDHYVFISDSEKITLADAKNKKLKIWTGTTKFIN